MKKNYINFRYHQNNAVDIVVDNSSTVITEMDGKPISGRGYRPCFNRFLLNVQRPNERNQWLILVEIRSYMLIQISENVFLKTSTILNHNWLWAKIYSALLEKIKVQFSTSSNCL